MSPHAVDAARRRSRRRAIRPRLARLLALTFALTGGLCRVSVEAQPQETPALALHGYVQLWWTIHEGAENGLRQPTTHDAAADEASGFLVRRARLAGDFRADRIRGRITVRLEGSPVALLDAYAILPLHGAAAELWAGQMKIPSVYELEVPDEALEFTTRSRFAEAAAEYALSRSPSLASRLTGVRGYQRDLGVALKGSVPPLRYFAMVGNGLGANQYVGGPSTRQEVYANSFGAYFYAARVACRPLPALEIGGHASWNDHRNAVLDDRRTVLDIRRSTWSIDLHATPVRPFELTGMYGAGRVDDDIDSDGRIDYEFRGWEARLDADVLPQRLRAGLRYDALGEESYESGVEDLLHAFTAGLTWSPQTAVRLQVEYQHNLLDSDANPDLNDDLFVLAGQISF